MGFLENLNLMLNVKDSGAVRAHLNDQYNYIIENIPELKGMYTLKENPEYHTGTTWEHVVRVTCELPPQLRLVGIFHDIGKPETAKPSTKGDWYTFHKHDKVGADLIENEIGPRLGMSELLIRCLSTTTLLHMRAQQCPVGGPTNKMIRRFQREPIVSRSIVKILAPIDSPNLPESWEKLFEL